MRNGGTGEGCLPGSLGRRVSGVKCDQARWCYCIGREMLGGSIGSSVGACGGSEGGVLRMESK